MGEIGVWGERMAGARPEDADGDGVVDFDDINSVLGNWLAACLGGPDT